MKRAHLARHEFALFGTSNVNGYADVTVTSECQNERSESIRKVFEPWMLQHISLASPRTVIPR